MNGFLGQKFYAEANSVVYPDWLDHCNNNGSGVPVPLHKVWIGEKMAQGLPVSDCELYLIGFVSIVPPSHKFAFELNATK